MKEGTHRLSERRRPDQGKGKKGKGGEDLIFFSPEERGEESRGLSWLRRRTAKGKKKGERNTSLSELR